MKFSIADYKKEDLIEAADNADYISAKMVDKPGAYDCTIKSMEHIKFPSGAEGVEFILQTNDNESIRHREIVKTKKGEDFYFDKRSNKNKKLPGVNKIIGGFLPCVKAKEMVPVSITVDGKQKSFYKSVEGKKIGVLINIKLVNGKPDKDGNVKDYVNQEIQSFYEVGTNFTGSEILGKAETPVKKAKIEEKLKVIDERKNIQVSSSNEDNPFGDNPFEDNKTSNESNDQKENKSDDVFSDSSKPTKEEEIDFFNN